MTEKKKMRNCRSPLCFSYWFSFFSIAIVLDVWCALELCHQMVWCATVTWSIRFEDLFFSRSIWIYLFRCCFVIFTHSQSASVCEEGMCEPVRNDFVRLHTLTRSITPRVTNMNKWSTKSAQQFHTREIKRSEQVFRASQLMMMIMTLVPFRLFFFSFPLIFDRHTHTHSYNQMMIIVRVHSFHICYIHLVRQFSVLFPLKYYIFRMALLLNINVFGGQNCRNFFSLFDFFARIWFRRRQ